MPDYEEITVPSGQVESISLGSGDVLENTVIDITATDADVNITASGSGWEIRSVAVRGSSRGRGNGVNWAMIWFQGDGVIENVYLGDGTAPYTRRTGIACVGGEHNGHAEIRDCYLSGWTDNAIYTAHNVPHGGSGTTFIEDCYFHDNNVSSIRLAVDGSGARGCVVHNTNDVPELPNGDVWSRGVFTFYGNESMVVEIDGCDIDVTDSNTNGRAFSFAGHSSGGGESSLIHVENTEYLGDVTGPSVRFGSGNGNNPSNDPPSTVPMTAEEAAEGPADPSIVAGEAIDVGQTWMEVEAHVESLGGHDSVLVHLEYERLSDGDSEGIYSLAELDGPATVTHVAEGLTPGEEYEWAFYITDPNWNWLDHAEFITTATEPEPDPEVTVETLPAEGVGETEATLAGEVISLEDADEAEAFFEWGPVGSGFPNESERFTVGEHQFRADLDGLDDGTEYEYRAVAAVDGDDSVGQAEFFETERVENVVVETHDAVDVGATCATLQGDLVDLYGVGEAEVFFEWGEAGGTLSESTSPRSVSVTGIFDTPVTGLDPETEYEFRAVAVGYEDDSAGDVTGFRTAEITDSTGDRAGASGALVLGIGLGLIALRALGDD